MIDNKIVALLENDDPEQRKRGVKMLAQSKDPEALPYLAEIVRYDENAEVADLARKAGIFIKKNSSGAPAPAAAPRRPAAPPPVESVYPDDDEATGAELRLEDIVVSEGDIGRAKSMTDQALATHMRGDNDKASQYLTRAFTINPKLRFDSYTVGLAATITGLPSDDAVKLLAPPLSELRMSKRSESSSGGATAATPRLMTLLLFMSASILLVGYLLFPWIDFSPIPTVGLDGQQTTFGQALQQMKTLISSTFEGAAPDTLPAEIKQALSALAGIKVDFTGLETAMLSTGLANVLDVMGFGALAELSNEPLPAIPAPPVEPLDYTLLLIPLVAIVAAIIGLLLMARGGSVRLWVTIIVFGLIGMVPFWYFFTQVRNDLLESSAAIDVLGQMNISSGLNLVAYGFWISLIAQLAVLFIPFIALIMAKPQTEA